MVSVNTFLNKCLAQKGDRYVFGAETSPLDPNPSKFDCSELFEWASAQVGLVPRLPDGAYYQWRHCRNHDMAISVQEGIHTPGALLFFGDGTGVGRDAITHVAASLGNGTTIEARGSKWGVGVWSAERGFDFAAKIPGLDYKATTPETDPRLPVKLRYGRGDAGPHVDFARAMLNIVWKYRINAQGKAGGRQIAMTGPVDNEFIEAVREFQRYCDKFTRTILKDPKGFDISGLMGPRTTKALSDWVKVALEG